MEPMEPDRPLGITILSIVGFVVGAWHGLVAMFALAFASSMVMITILGGYIPPDGALSNTGWAIVSLIGALALLAASLGLWTMRKWAYWVALAGAGLALLARVVPGLQGATNSTSMFSALLAAAVVVYLLLPGVRHAFLDAPADDTETRLRTDVSDAA